MVDQCTSGSLKAAQIRIELLAEFINKVILLGPLLYSIFKRGKGLPGGQVFFRGGGHHSFIHEELMEDFDFRMAKLKGRCLIFRADWAFMIIDTFLGSMKRFKIPSCSRK
jgi:hypothetical protein